MSSSQITYSSSYPLIITRLCSNKCGYCEFPVVKKDHLPSKKNIISKISKAARCGATSIQLIAGEEISEHPSIVTNIKYYGYSNYLEYIKMAIESVISFNSNSYLIPSLDVGILPLSDLILYRDWIFSLKISLESVDIGLMSDIPHRESPGKKPELRTSALIAAGHAKIPTTTGIIIGIGEKPYFRFKAIEIISELHEKYNHIQAFSIKRFYPVPNTPMANYTKLSDKAFINFVREARKILSPSIPIQINVNKEESILIKLIEAGATDIGEIDLSNEKCSHLDKYLAKLCSFTEKYNIKLRERLPVFDSYIVKGWFPQRFLSHVKAFYLNKLNDSKFANNIKKCIVPKNSK